MTYSCLRQGPRAEVPDFSGRTLVIFPVSSKVRFRLVCDGDGIVGRTDMILARRPVRHALPAAPSERLPEVELACVPDIVVLVIGYAADVPVRILFLIR